MKKKIILLFIFTFSCLANSQAQSLASYPSFYYTHGVYSSDTKSNSYAFYNTLQFSSNFYLVNSFENLLIDNPDFRYDQKNMVTQAIFVYSPLTLKFAYGFYFSQYDYLPSFFQYEDNLNLFAADLIYNSGSYYIGATYVHSNLLGLIHQKVDQFTGRIEKLFGTDLFVSLKPSYSILEDGRKLSSASLKTHYLVSPNLLLKVGGFIGQRAYYFDSDLITFFNQNETQKNNYWGQIEYSFQPELKVVFAYQKTKFSSYSIQYLILGIKSKIEF